MLVKTLSILDIVAGIALFAINILPPSWTYALGIILFIKGAAFLSMAFAKKSFEWMSALDVAVAIVLLARADVGWFAIVPILKGAYCLALSSFK